MPKVPSHSTVARQRHNPLSEEYSPSQPLKQKATKKRKSALEAEDNVVGSKASRRILKIGQDLVDEDLEEQKKSQPNPAFDFQTRLEDTAEVDDEEELYENDDDAWGSEDEVVEEVEIDPNDQDIFNRFLPSKDTDVDRDLNNFFKTQPDTNEDAGQGTNLADLILEKIAAQEAAAASGGQTLNDQFDDLPEEDQELPPKVVEVYTTVGQLLSRHRSGPLPKPFKILPSLPESQIPLLINLTEPENWTPHVYFLATRLFISSKPGIAQPFLQTILLPKVRDEIQETKKLHVHLYSALKKSLYKPAAFFKGILFPLLTDACTLREAHIISSVLARVSVPVLHSAAALLRLCDIAAEQFSTRKEDGGGGATNIFIRCLLDKKYALPYKVIDALVFHFLRFKALDTVSTAGQDDAVMSDGFSQQGQVGGKGLPVLWHQSLLSFAQRYRNDITEDQREALLDLVAAKGHRAIGPEVRRELLEGRGRGIPAFEAGADVEGGDDTMMMDERGVASGDFSFGKAGTLLGGPGTGVAGGDDTMLMA